MGQLFGTDGIRGRANTYPMTCDMAMKTGRAVGMLTLEAGHTSVVIGRDTRISGGMLEAALAAGIASVGVDALLAGVIPTPGVAYLSTVIETAGAGIVISASHNPYYDNGIKIFRRGGLKLSDAQEAKLESFILEEEDVPRGEVGVISEITDGCERYADFLLGKFPVRKPGEKLNLIIDAANGAASGCVGLVFNPDLFDVQFIHNEPDGININNNCGSQHTEALADLVRKNKADAGLAFDGDADRLIAVDDTGREITGDRILAICANYSKSQGRLHNNIVVSTIMSNIGLVNALNSLGIDHEITDVGDRKVLERMQETGATIGGEDSGHMIFLADHTTGDGMLTALKLLEVMAATGQPLSRLADIMTVYPQILMNVEVDASRPDFTKIPGIADAIAGVEKHLGDQGRVLVRYSGTQPLLRVMVEGPEEEVTRESCERICQAIRDNM
ncbi:MAG TPA: phosphoglucosamine mutase [Desulfobacteraceae bacterium]|nr:phosphoglucosamine mutase [Desulfobacteraceae bacterium]